MPVERYYFEGPLSAGSAIILEGGEVHHLVNVMRSVKGDTVEVVNGRGVLASASIQSIEKKRHVTLMVGKVTKQRPPRHEIVIVQAIPRLNRLDFILEKGTELGMTQLWLFPGERSERKSLNVKAMERMKAVCVGAMKQCGRLFLPEVVVKPPLLEWSRVEGKAFFGDLNASAPSFISVLKECRVGDMFFFVGPESGFSSEEEKHLRTMGTVGVKLHENILRTDTAAIVAVALMKQWGQA